MFDRDPLMSLTVFDLTVLKERKGLSWSVFLIYNLLYLEIPVVSKVYILHCSNALSS